MSNLGSVSILNINGNELSIKDSSLTSVVNEIIEAIAQNNEDISEHINDLNDKSFDALIKIGGSSQQSIDSIQDGVYKVQNVHTNNDENVVDSTYILLQEGNNQLKITEQGIYTRSKSNNTWTSWTNDNHQLSSGYVMSSSSNENLLLTSGDTYEEAFGKLEKSVIDNELIVANALNDLNSKIDDVEIPVTSVNGATGDVIISLALPNNYAAATATNIDLELDGGDTYNEAFGKIEKRIDDDELVIAGAFNDLNTNKANINDLATVAFSGSYNHLSNKPIIPVTSVNGATGNVIIDLSLSNNYTAATATNEDLFLDAGDTFEEAFGKLEKSINDNEYLTSQAINELNSKVNNIVIPENVSSFTNDAGYYNGVAYDDTNLNLDFKDGATVIDSLDIKEMILRYGVEFIKGTQGATTPNWTGVSKSNSLYDGKSIAYYLPKGTTGNATLKLAMADGTTTAAIPVCYTNSTQIPNQIYGAGSVILLTYVASVNQWRRCDYNTNTTYSLMSLAELQGGTVTSQRTISAQRLKQAYNINGQVITIGNATISVPTQLSQLSDDSTHRLVSDADISLWNEGAVHELSNDYVMSSYSNDALFLAAGDSFEAAFGKMEKAILENEEITAAGLADLDARIEDMPDVTKTGSYDDLEDKPNLAPVAISGDYLDLQNKPILSQVANSGSFTDLINVPSLVNSVNGMTGNVTLNLALSNNYAAATAINDNLFLDAGDTYEEAFGKLEKMVNDNEYVISHSLTDLDNKITDVQTDLDNKITDVQTDVDNLADVAESGSYNDLSNKPYISNIEDVVVSVDNGTGIPQATSAIYNNTLSLSFNNLKGEKGDQGDTLIIGNGTNYTLYNSLGENTDGAVSQNKVTELYETLTTRIDQLDTDCQEAHQSLIDLVMGYTRAIRVFGDVEGVNLDSYYIIEANESFVHQLEPEPGYAISSVTITMDETATL